MAYRVPLAPQIEARRPINTKALAFRIDDQITPSQGKLLVTLTL
jgi:hypothetical protein